VFNTILKALAVYRGEIEEHVRGREFRIRSACPGKFIQKLKCVCWEVYL
jgi:hypothetical protein